MIDLTHLFTAPIIPNHLQTAAEYIQTGKNVILAMPPRSGKTSLAVSYAKCLVKERKKVLYITFNRILAESTCRDCGCDAVGLNDLSSQFGIGYDAILVDDILRGENEAYNAQHVKMAITWLDSIMMSSACHSGTRTIILGSRWHENDFIGNYKLLAQSWDYCQEWGGVDIPAIWKAEDGTEHSYWPEQYPLEDLNKIRQSISADDFKWLYQQGVV